MNPTTRRYPRTSLRQSDMAYGAAIEKPPRRYRAVNWALFFGGVAVILSICFQGVPK